MSIRSVLLVSTNADLAGAPIHVGHLAKGLASRGVRVGVVFGEKGPIRTELANLGMDTWVVPTIRSNFDPAQDIRSVASIRRLIREFQPEMIHAHSSKAGMVARIGGAFHKVPVIYTVHGWGFGPGRKRSVSALVRLIERMLRSHTCHYIAVSEHDRKIGLQELGIAPAKLSKVYNGVPHVADRAHPEVSSSIVMVARHSPQKDYATFLRAVNGLPCDVLCIGSGTATEDFRQRGRSLAPHSGDRVRYLGVRANVGQVLASCGVFVLSTFFEGLPISIIEAMRAGLPIVACDVGGVSELVIEGRNGFLLQAGDVDSLQAILAKLSSDPVLRKRLGAESRELYCERFAIETMMTETMRIYGKVSDVRLI